MCKSHSVHLKFTILRRFLIALFKFSNYNSYVTVLQRIFSVSFAQNSHLYTVQIHDYCFMLIYSID